MAVKRDLHTLGLIACGLKIAAGTLYYFFLDFAKETCVPNEAQKKDDKHCGVGGEKFDRPFFTAAFLFFGMSFTLIPYFLFKHNKPGVTKVDRQTFINMIFPSILEFIGQSMFMIGILYMPMSLALTLKGARVVFSALLLVALLGRKLFGFHWAAVVATIVGLAVASVPTIMNPSGKSKTATETVIGICLVLAAEFIRSMRTVVEEKMMKKLKYEPMLVVGLQGIYALSLAIPTLFVVNKIQRNGKPFESIDLTFDQFSSSDIIIGLFSTFPVVVPGLFICGAYVTKLMSAVHNALTNILTNALVWIMAIIVHYIDNGRGKTFAPIDCLQLLGFFIVLFSSLIYDAILRIPQVFTYPLDRTAASGAGSCEKSVLGIANADSKPEICDNTSEETKPEIVTKSA